MERVLSDEEKIRRAIEISQRRNNYYRTENLRKENIKENKKEYKLFKRMFIQIVICFFIYGAFYLISNRNFIFSSEIINKTNSILSYDVNFKEWYERGKYGINGFINNWKRQNSSEEIKLNEISSIETNTNEDDNIQANEIEVQEESSKNDVQEDNRSQMEKDVDFIKNKYSFIKPINGKITSRFGEREVLINGMTSDHKGIDIAANKGTEIKAAIDGQVEVASSNSQYGKFIKIKKDDILTVYAHCKELKVSKGDKINQGDVIATVGTTGVSTGPHLHFEIRFNNRYIDPELIIQY